MEIRHVSVEIDGAKIRERRKDVGLTLSELAKRASISIPYASAIERGHRPTVPPATFHRIREALDVPFAKRASLVRSVSGEAA